MAKDKIFVERLWRSVRYEGIYLKGYANMGGLTIGLTQYFSFYNHERPHQSLADQTPGQGYESAQGGVAIILDEFTKKDSAQSVVEKSGQRCSAVCKVETKT